MEFIVDFQAFKSSNKFIIKELTILPVNGSMGKTVLFKPPLPFCKLLKPMQKQVRWLEKHYHGIRWSLGNTNYGDIVKIFSEMNVRGYVLVTDRTKKQHMEEILLPFFNIQVLNLQDFGCPSLKVLKQREKLKYFNGCPFQHNSLNCAQLNAELLLQWWKTKNIKL